LEGAEDLMKAKFFLAGASLFAMAYSQQIYRFERKYVEGEKDAYSFKMSMNLAQGSVDILMTQNWTVAKVYENGDADVETETTGTKIRFNGNEMDPPGGQANTKTTVRVNKYGAPLSTGSTGAGAGQRMGQNMAFTRFAAMVGETGISVGQTVPIDYVDPKDPKITAKGSVKLESVDAGVAKLISNIDLTNAQTADKPIKMVATTFVDTTSSKLNKSEGTLTNLPSQGPVTPDAIQYVIERKVG